MIHPYLGDVGRGVMSSSVVEAGHDARSPCSMVLFFSM